MASGEINITCPNCQQRSTLPIAAVRRDNFYCSKCGKKVPLAEMRTSSGENQQSAQPPRPKKSSRYARR